MMQHLGDITKLDGSTIEPVWCVTGGSPCQDLSIAGKRAGLAGARSGLFMEQIRVIKEMREHDKRLGRAGEFIRPRYMVWENVCFAGETLVACKSGYKRIDQIAVGDEVKTHTGMYRPVAKVMRTKNQAVVRLKVSGAEDIICTPNHPLYIMEKVYANAGKKQGRSFTEPRWEAAGNLNDRCMVAYKLDEPTLPDNFITQDEAWALGRYIADGSVDLNRGTPRIFISVGNAKLEEAREHLHRLPYELHENAPHATVTNMVFSSQEFYNLVSGVGRGAGNKRVPTFVFELPVELQRCVLDGYISGDGCIRERGKCKELCCVTASRELAYGIARMIRNVFHVGANISVRKPKDGKMGGRIIKANYPCYCVTATLTKKVSTSVCKDGFVWQMVKSVDPCREKATVYNLSVWEDNTYGANDVVAHNCGAFSSNKGRDFAAVLEEIIKIVEPEAPGIEVPEKGWPTWGGYHDEVGGRWSVVWRTHDAQYWGVPQRRRRISVVADFGGDTASEILFDRKSVSGDIAESGAEGERPAEAAEAGANSAVRDVTTYCLQGNGIDRADTAGCNGKGWREDSCYTLNTIDRPAVVAPAVAYSFDSLSSNSMKSKNPHSGCREVDVAKTLDTTDPTPSKNQGGIAVVAPAVMCLNDQGGSVMGVSHDVFGTLRAQEHGHNPSILDMSHACDVIRECGERVPSLQARMGTGGNQVPLVYGIGNGQSNEASIMAEEVSQTLNTMHDAQAVMCEDVSHALRAKAGCAYREDAETYPVQNMVVRRLTPLKCERLQGFPDGWTDIGDYTDSTGKKRKTSDSARYKALGNSIALPFWRWMFGRMAAYLPEGATLGSLFDGISGFNVCWARIHGAECCRWSSEIEQFPIAVTKKHFGDEEAGKEGDFEKFFGRNKKENV